MPKPFVFKLERVLDYRRQLEDEAVAALASAQAAHDAQLAVVTDVQTRLGEHQRKGVKQGGTRNDFWLFKQYEDGLKQDLSSAREALAQLALKLQKCRQDAVERSKERKLLEKLKEKESKRYHHEATLREQKEYDELAILRRTDENQ